MAHEIGEMFYYGERPWHTLGKRLTQPATLAEALTAGGLDWRVGMVPMVPAGEPDSAIVHRVAVVREDRLPGEAGRVVGVVHPGFRPLQNREGAELFDALVGQGAPVYHTGGYLRHGEVVWLLARLPQDITVQGQDVVEPYLLYTNSHDGSVAIDIRLTTIRVVCQNTLSLALSGTATGKIFRRSHASSYALLKEQAKAFFEFAMRQCEQAQALFSRLAKAPCGDASFQAFLVALMPDPKRPVTAAQNLTVQRAYDARLESIRRTREEVLNIHWAGIPHLGIAPSDDTLWGAVNTITAWVDHIQSIEGDRYAHILMGSGDRLKTSALARATAIAA